MKDAKKFWFIFILTVVVALVLHCQGCKPPDPSRPPVARRHFTGEQRAGSITSAGQCGYDSRPDGGASGHPVIGVWSQFTYADGDPSDIGGAKMELKDSWNTGMIIPKTAYTNDQGRTVVYIEYDTSHVEGSGYMINWGLLFSGPRSGCMLLGNVGRSGPLGIAYYEKISGWGEFYASGSRFGDGQYNDPARNPTPRPRLSGIPVTVQSQSFLEQEPIISSELAVSVVSEKWYMAKHGDEGWTSRNANELHYTPKEDSVIRDSSTPYFIEWCFYTAKPRFLQGAVFTGNLKTFLREPNDFTDPNDYATIPVTVITDSENLLSHVARSGFMCPVEPNEFSAYTVTTGNGVDILVCPLVEGDSLRIEFDDRNQFLPYVSDEWLTDFIPFDINKDGIVNMLDLP